MTTRGSGRTGRPPRVLGVAFAALVALGCARETQPPNVAPGASSAAEPSGEWLTKSGVAHELTGRIWDVRAGGFTGIDALSARLAGARFVLLGEKHDNPDHHRLQALVIEKLVERGRRPAIAFEMLELPAQRAIDRYRNSDGATAAGFGAALSWEKTRWPPFAEYRPIFEVAFAENLPIAAANLEHGIARALVGRGLGALDAERARELGLDGAFPNELEAPLLEELRASHCGKLPEEILAPMALAQHARDAQMARSLLALDPERGAVLVTGSGHARLDRGVPYYLKLLGSETSVASLAIVEVAESENQPENYAARFGSDRLPFDFVWFTPRLNDDDPCAAFGEPTARDAFGEPGAGAAAPPGRGETACEKPARAYVDAPWTAAPCSPRSPEPPRSPLARATTR